VAVGTQARWHGVRARQSKSGSGVVERSIGPQHRVVARLASRREARGDMVHRRSRGVVVVLVARHAGGARQVVVVVNVAIRALTRRHSVRSRQHEAGAVVIEGRIQPGSRVVALVAGLREVRRDVIRIRRALEVLQVASHASSTAQRVVVVDVAVRARAWWNGVHAGQSESRRRVIKFAVGPQHRIVALLTGRRESSVRHRRRRVVVVVLVARDACRTCDVVVVIDVAVRALARRDHVRSRQRES